MRDVLIENCWSLIYNEWGKISRHADIMPCSKYLTTIWVGSLGKQTQHPRGNHRPVNNHPLLPPLYKTYTRVATSKVRYFRGTVTRLGCAHKSAQGGKVGRSSSSLVFTTVTDRLQHLHMKRSEQYFSNTTDTLWLSGGFTGLEQVWPRHPSAVPEAETPNLANHVYGVGGVSVNHETK